MVLFSASLISRSTSLTTIVETLAHRDFAIYPGLAFAGVAFTMVSLAENARAGGQPGDAPRADDDPRGADSQYSGRHLALIEWAASPALRLDCMGSRSSSPGGVAEAGEPVALLLALPVLLVKARDRRRVALALLRR